MSEWELRLSQKEIHRMQVVGLAIEGQETVGGARLWDLCPSDEAAAV